MKSARFGCLFVLFAVATALAQSNPVPLVNQPLVPTATAPGGPTFVLTVNGTGFVPGSAVNWNGTPLSTTFVSSSQLTATVPASNIAKASTASITVSSPSPGGGISNPLFFSVSAPTTLQFTSLLASLNDCFPCYNLIAADLNRDGKLDLTLTRPMGEARPGLPPWAMATEHFIGNWSRARTGIFPLLLTSTETGSSTWWEYCRAPVPLSAMALPKSKLPSPLPSTL
jgi:hypothetical protein